MVTFSWLGSICGKRNTDQLYVSSQKARPWTWTVIWFSLSNSCLTSVGVCNCRWGMNSTPIFLWPSFWTTDLLFFTVTYINGLNIFWRLSMTFVMWKVPSQYKLKLLFHVPMYSCAYDASKIFIIPAPSAFLWWYAPVWRTGIY